MEDGKAEIKEIISFHQAISRDKLFALQDHEQDKSIG